MVLTVEEQIRVELVSCLGLMIRLERSIPLEPLTDSSSR
jgi:hypothetical protein